MHRAVILLVGLAMPWIFSPAMTSAAPLNGGAASATCGVQPVQETDNLRPGRCLVDSGHPRFTAGAGHQARSSASHSASTGSLRVSATALAQSSSNIQAGARGVASAFTEWEYVLLPAIPGAWSEQTVSIHLDGFLTADESSTFSTYEADLEIDVWINDNLVETSTYHHWMDPSTYNRDQELTFVNSEQFTAVRVKMEARVIASALSWGLLGDALGVASARFGNTISWGGITEVLDENGNRIEDFTAIGDGGIDFRHAISTPEPTRIALFAVLFAALWRRSGLDAANN